MKLLVDMNLSPNWVAEFRSRGVESIHWSGLGAASATDEEILAWCASHDHVLFTNDLDFGAILAASRDRTPSVVQMRTEDVTPQAMGKRVAEALVQLEDVLAAGALVTIEPGRNRVRLLPLARG